MAARSALYLGNMTCQRTQLRSPLQLSVSPEIPGLFFTSEMTSIRVKLFSGESFALSPHEQRAVEALAADGCLLLLGAALESPEVAAISSDATIARIGGDSNQCVRIEVEGGKYLDANGGDILICQPTRAFELVRPLLPLSDSGPRRATKPPKTFFCPVSGCNSSFNRRDNLRRHLKDPTRGPRHAEYAKELDAPLPQNQISVAVEKLSGRYPAIALVPEVRGFEEVQGIEEKLAAICRSLLAVFQREFGGFELWGEVRIGGNAVGEAGSSAGPGPAN